MSEPKKISEGAFAGFSYLIRTGAKVPCILCGVTNPDRPIMLAFSEGRDEKPSPGICEPCSHLARWAWSATKDAAIPPSAFPTAVTSSLVFVLRENSLDLTSPNPYQVALVARKDDNAIFALPGGKLNRHEDPEDAAVRELYEETGLATWKSALEPLYLAYSPRGNLVKTYLCRAYHGKLEPKETPVAWKDWSPKQMSKTAHYAGYYMGLMEAVKARILLQKISRSKMAISTSLSASATHYTNLYLRGMRDESVLSADDLSLLEGCRYAIKPNESEVLDLIITNEEKRLDMPVRGLPPAGSTPKPSRRNALKAVEEEAQEDGDEDTETEGDDNDNGFVRPPPPKQE